MRPRNCTVAIALAACLFATTAEAARGFTRIDFKYGSSFHLPPSARFVELSATPNTVARLLDQLVREDGAYVLERTRGEGIVVSVPENGRECWKGAVQVAKLEWSAFNLNRLKDYKKIDRSGICDGVLVGEAGAVADSVKVSAEFPTRAADATIRTRVVDNVHFDGSGLKGGADSVADAVLSTVGGLSMNVSTVDQQVNAKFASRIHFSIWREGDRTKVYAWAVPVNSGIEAGPGYSIGLAWKDEIRGERESRLVRTYLTVLQDLVDDGRL